MSKRSSDREDRRSRDAKKRKSRWASETSEKTYIPGMPTILPGGMDTKQEQMYLLQLQIEDFTRRLRSGDLGIPPNPEDRSPSPEPIYNQEGKRLNTREYRTRRKLEEDRHRAVQKLLQENPDYKPPSDYKPPAIKITDKVYIPQDEHPEINFVGLLIGPRGNTLKTLEKETGAKVIIRGKGSVKEGKVGRKDGLPMPGEDEPLHAFITGSTQESVTKCVERINKVIKQGIEIPESQNDLRKQQLRELALLNGTLRENEGLAKLKAIAEAQTIATNTIVCSACGGAGHLASDCKAKRPGESLMAMETPTLMGSAEDRAKMDSEYTALMAELGVADNMPGGGGSQLGGNRGGKDSRGASRSWQAPPPRVQQQQRLAGNGTSVGGVSSGSITPLLGTTSGGMMQRSIPPPLMSQTCTYAGHVDTDWLTTHPPPPGTEPTHIPTPTTTSPPGGSTGPRVGIPPIQPPPPPMSQGLPPLPQGPPPPPQHMAPHPPQPPPPQSAGTGQWRDPQPRLMGPQPAAVSSSSRSAMGPGSWPGPPPPRPPGPPPMMSAPPAPTGNSSSWMNGPPPPMPPGSGSGGSSGGGGSASVPPPQWMGGPPPMPAPPTPPGAGSSTGSRGGAGGGSSSWGMAPSMPPLPPPPLPNSNSGWSGPPPPPPRGPPPPLPPPPAYPSNPPPPPPSTL